MCVWNFLASCENANLDADSIIETLNSISNQTYKNWQLIIINDGSTDNVESIIKEYTDNVFLEHLKLSSVICRLVKCCCLAMI